MKEIIAIKFIL